MIHNNAKGFVKPWAALTVFLVILILLPICALILQSISQSDAIFDHLIDTVLGDYVVNTVTLIGMTVVMVFVIAVPLAWLTVMCQFPGVRYLSWLLVFPLAIPPYLLAYLYTDLMDYAGPVQTFLRALFGWENVNDYWFFDMRSIPGASMVLSLVLYPYVYLPLRVAWQEQSVQMLQSSRLLGVSSLRYFVKVAMPLARPTIIAGLALVAMEVLADFATVNYFSVATLTTAIYDTWLGHSNLTAASKIAASLLLGVLLLVWIERLSRNRINYEQKGQLHKQPPFKLKGFIAFIASFWCFLILCIAFFLPLFLLLKVAFNSASLGVSDVFYGYLLNSFVIAFVCALICFVIGLWLVFYRRDKPGLFSKVSTHIGSLGYAIPGTVLAIAVLIPLSGIDHWFNGVLKNYGFNSVGLIFSGSIIAIIYAYVIRFVPLSIGVFESTYARIPNSLDMVSYTLGQKSKRMFTKIHWPLLRKSVVVAIILVFIESLKELPAVLLLRPFNFETMATWVYGYVIDEQLESAAMGAVILVLSGVIGVLFLHHYSTTRALNE